MAEELEHLYSELFEAAATGRRVGESIAATAGQTQSRWQTMWTIDADTALTVPQIARRLGMTRQNEQRVVNALVADGLAELSENPDHKASPLVSLTADGRRALRTINRAAEQSHAAILSQFSPTQVRQLRRLLAAFTAASVEPPSP